MARLNEPPPSVEAIDALKRRFVRQNREIARANSTQSLRIRNLESEISRLLAENIAFREQCIKLQYEVANGPGRGAMESVGEIKGRLETKLTELGCLVQELGAVQKSKRNRSPRRKSTTRSSPKRSPDQKNWRNALTLSEVTGGIDGRLPPIVEGKYFPRRTLDAEELMGMMGDPANATDSPDLGPPPIAHFDEGDPIKFDHNQIALSRKNASPNSEEEHPPLPANLETRKKRRESAHHLETSRSVATDTTSTTGQALKTGAKRKLNTRDDDDLAEKFQEKDAFHFNRIHVASTTVENNLEADEKGKSIIRKVSQDLATVREMSRDKSKETPMIAITTARKALGPKSVNTDPLVSPAKIKDNASKDKVNEFKDDMAKKPKSRPRPRDKFGPGEPAPRPKEPNPTKDPVEPATLLPETPVPPPFDLFPPVSSGPSGPGAPGRDTPPPSDLRPESSSTNAFGTAGRGSRRPRGSVSYAEPNLRDKMRRPTKELVDAVGADDRIQILGSRKIEGMVSETEFGQENNKRTVVIKKEPTDDVPSWKFPPLKDSQHQHESNGVEPTSPLGSKSSAAAETDLPSSVLTDRRRRTMTVHRASDDPSTEPAKPSSGAGTAIAALVAGSSKPRKREAGEAHGDEKISEYLENGDIYDLHTSSPPPDKGTAKEAPPRASSRRHSSVPALAEDAKASVARRGDRRRNGLAGIAAGGGGERGTGRAGEGLKGSRSVVGLKARDGGGGEGVGGGAREERAERAAGRRRSMML